MTRPSYYHCQPGSAGLGAPITSAAPVTITPANICPQQAAGAPVSVSAFLTFPRHGCTLRVVLGAGAVACTHTIVGTWAGAAVTEAIACTGTGTFEGAQPFATVTSWTSNVNPQDTSDLQSLDPTWLRSPDVTGSIHCPRWLYIGGTGDVSVRLYEDAADTLFAAVPVGRFDVRPLLIRCDVGGRAGIDPTTATDIVYGL